VLIEREVPLNLLNEALHQAKAGQGRIIVVGGEAGIGKSSLLRNFAAGLSSFKVFWGSCEALFAPRPLGPLQDMAGGLDQRVAALLEETAPQDRIFPAVLSALQNARDPVVLIFEDVHWADNATLDLLKYLGRRIAFLRAALVVSLRSDEVGASHPLAQVLGDLPAMATVRIELPPLTESGVAALTGRSKADAGPFFRITAGNPFFITELLAGGGNASGLPASVRDAVWARLQRLPPMEIELLETLSIEPGGAEPWLTTALCGPSAEMAIDVCLQRGLVNRSGGVVRFRHELARAATLARLAPSQQKALHRRTLDALEEHGDAALSRLLHHAQGAEDSAKVLDLAPRAAAEAAKLGAHSEAAVHLSAAMNYASAAPPEILAQLLEDWSYEAGLALQIDDAIINARRRAVELWRGLERFEKVILNLRWLSRLHWYRGESQLAGEYADLAVATAEGQPMSREAAMAISVRSQMHMLSDHAEEAIAWGHKALQMADALGDVETRVHALNNIACAYLFSGRDGGEPLMEESLALALKHGFHEQAARAYTNYSGYGLETRKLELAERIISEGIAFDTRHDLDAWTHYLVGRQAELRMEQGRFSEAEVIACSVLKLERLTLVMRLPARTVLAKVHMRRGEADAGELLAEVLADALATNEAQNIFPARVALVEHAWLAGDGPRCQNELRQIAAMRLEGFDLWELGDFAVWWKRAGMAETFPAEGVLAPPRQREVSGDAAGAAEIWARLGLPYEAALSLLQDPDKIAEAIAALEQIGAGAALQLGLGMARRRGIAVKARRGPYGPARTHPQGLTRREIEILGLLSNGLGNAEIARRLSRSPRTVEHHVSSLLAKLNATSRMDVVLRLRNEPWLVQPSLEIRN
jgi:DNA-binding CsgD family transcriptional regulator/tetratricopeptide (TPR) repeat protein